MLTTRRSTIVASGVLLGLLGLAVFLNTATAGKPPAPPPPRPTAPPYSITFLQPPVSNSWIRAYAMNNSGDIVGTTTDAAGRHVGFLSTVENGVRQTYDLNDTLTLADQWYLQDARDINDAGQIVGNGQLNGIAAGYRYTPAYTDVLGFHPAEVEKVEGLSGAAQLIDPSGNNVLDGYGVLATYDPATGLWTTQDLRGGLYQLYPYRFNGSGQVCGYAFFASDGGRQKAFRYTPGVGVVNLGFIAYNKGRIACSYAYDMDEQGQVVGSSTAGGNSYETRAMRYTDATGMVDLGTLGGTTSGASGINRLGTMIVGGAKTRDSVFDHMFLYTSAKGMMDLEAAIVNLPPEYKFNGTLSPIRINDAGCVCGNATMANGNRIAFLLTPTGQ
jgi:probable HAF family extracellular repeat protein